jgi:hypothetical protein
MHLTWKKGKIIKKTKQIPPFFVEKTAPENPFDKCSQ